MPAICAGSFAENIILIDTGYAKLMSPYFDLEELRQVEGFENARFADPYAGGKGNSVRYMSVGVRDGYMRACGLSNLLLGGEKSGFCRSYGSHIHRFTGGVQRRHDGRRKTHAEAAPLTGDRRTACVCQ